MYFDNFPKSLEKTLVIIPFQGGETNPRLYQSQVTEFLKKIREIIRALASILKYE